MSFVWWGVLAPGDNCDFMCTEGVVMGWEDRGVVIGREERELLWEWEGAFHEEGVAAVVMVVMAVMANAEVCGTTGPLARVRVFQ